ncbi:MAG: DUF805 domain-containing protein [Cocleimonas sp.]|nr:DUF805 domain-containing protein [Cocleimonas sp.]
MSASETYPKGNLQRQRYSQVDLLSADGRIGRLRYFFYSIILPFLVFWVFAAVAGMTSKIENIGQVIGYVFLAAAIGAALYLLFQLTIQRCHDFNVSGWLSTLILIPFGTLIFWLIPGSQNINRYGEPPEPTSKWVTIGSYLLLIILIAALTYWLLKTGVSLDLPPLTETKIPSTN